MSRGDVTRSRLTACTATPLLSTPRAATAAPPQRGGDALPASTVPRVGTPIAAYPVSLRVRMPLADRDDLSTAQTLGVARVFDRRVGPQVAADVAEAARCEGVVREAR